jgi:hypothetical protein
MLILSTLRSYILGLSMVNVATPQRDLLPAQCRLGAHSWSKTRSSYPTRLLDGSAQRCEDRIIRVGYYRDSAAAADLLAALRDGQVSEPSRRL